MTQVLRGNQIEVVNEILKRHRVVLDLTMGFGKSVVAYAAAIEERKRYNYEYPILVICPVTLENHWKAEAEKFWGNQLNVLLLSSLKGDFTIPKNIDVIIARPDACVKSYKENDIEPFFIGDHAAFEIVTYTVPDRVIGIGIKKGKGILHNLQYAAIIVDEFELFTNIKTAACKAICTLYSENRYLLSGTSLSHDPDRLLGFILLLGEREPNSRKDLKRMISDPNFPGFKKYMISRDENQLWDYLDVEKPILDQKIIYHSLNEAEKMIYEILEELIRILKQSRDRYKASGNSEKSTLSNMQFLSMIGQFRLSTVQPAILVTNFFVLRDQEKSEVADRFLPELDRDLLKKWLYDEDNFCSSRIKAILRTIDEFPDEKIILFGEYPSSLRAIEYYVRKLDRKVMVLTADMNSDARQKCLDDFQKTKNGIFISTYTLCARGLNMQFCSVLFAVDLCWHYGTLSQALKRINRPGQTAKVVHVRIFTSDTGIEKAMVEKQWDKRMVASELFGGPTTKKVNSTVMDDMVRIVEERDNSLKLCKVRKMREEDVIEM